MTRVSNFLRPRWNPPVRKKPAMHMHLGVVIVRKNGGIGMYVATVDGKEYSNTRLGDLKRQIGEVIDQNPQIEAEREEERRRMIVQDYISEGLGE